MIDHLTTITDCVGKCGGCGLCDVLFIFDHDLRKPVCSNCAVLLSGAARAMHAQGYAPPTLELVRRHLRGSHAPPSI